MCEATHLLAELMGVVFPAAVYFDFRKSNCFCFNFKTVPHPESFFEMAIKIH